MIEKVFITDDFFIIIIVYYDAVCRDLHGVPKRKDVLLRSQTGESNKFLTQSAVVVSFSLKLSKEAGFNFQFLYFFFF